MKLSYISKFVNPMVGKRLSRLNLNSAPTEGCALMLFRPAFTVLCFYNAGLCACVVVFKKPPKAVILPVIASLFLFRDCFVSRLCGIPRHDYEKFFALRVTRPLILTSK